MDEGNELMMGGGGVATFTLVGLAEGSCMFRAVEVREWEFAGWNENTWSNEMSYTEIAVSVSSDRDGGWIDPCTKEWWYADATEDWSLYDGCWET